MADDYIYRFVYHNSGVMPHMEKTTTLTIPYSMYNHYMNWNGRFVAHSVVQYFMQFDTKLVFDICNSLIFVVLLLLINKFATKLSGKKYNVFILPLIFFFTWFYIPYFGQTVLWVSGSGNYLWMSIIYLGFILYNLTNRELTVTNGIIAAILGFLAGASNENSGPAAVLIVLLFMIKRFIRDHKVNLNSAISVIFSGIGFILMMMSPGTQKRGEIHRTWKLISDHIQGINMFIISKFWLVYLLVVILLVVAIIMKKISMDGIWSVVFFVIGHFAAIYAMAFSPEYPVRTFFGGVIFLGISLFILVYSIFSEMKVTPFVVSAVLSICFVFSFIPAYHDISISYYQVEQQYNAFNAAKKDGLKDARVALMTKRQSEYNAYNGTLSLDESSKSWMNVWEAKFFGIDKISGYYQD